LSGLQITEKAYLTAWNKINSNWIYKNKKYIFLNQYLNNQYKKKINRIKQERNICKNAEKESKDSERIKWDLISAWKANGKGPLSLNRSNVQWCSYL
jgi:hypothetical protein